MAIFDNLYKTESSLEPSNGLVVHGWRS